MVEKREISRTVTEYIVDKYGAKPENPWAGYPDNTTFKDKLVDKW